MNERMDGAHISHSMWHSHIQRKGHTGASYPYTDPLRGGFNLFFFFLKHVFLSPKVSFSCLGSQKASFFHIQHHFLGIVQWALREMWENQFQDVPGAGNKVCSWEKLLNFLNNPSVPLFLGSIWACMWRILYCLGEMLHREVLLVLFFCGKCWCEREMQELLCILFLPGWSVVIIHISELSYCAISIDPSCSRWTDQSWFRSSGSFLSWYLEINCPPTPLDGSTVLGFHSLPALLQTHFSNYIPWCFSTSVFSCCLHSARNNVFL